MEEKCQSCGVMDAWNRENECQAHVRHMMRIVMEKANMDKDWNKVLKTLPSKSDEKVQDLVNARARLQNGMFLEGIYKLLEGAKNLFNQDKSCAQAIMESRKLLKDINALCWDHLREELRVSAELVDVLRSLEGGAAPTEDAAPEGNSARKEDATPLEVVTPLEDATPAEDASPAEDPMST